MNGRIRKHMVGVSLVLVALSGGTHALAQYEDWDPADAGSGSNDVTSQFRYYFSITTDPVERKNNGNWSEGLRFDTEVLSRDFVILYEGQTGIYPTAGPHLTKQAGYMDAHLAKLAIDLERQIPDPDFSGVAILDFEGFRAVWDRTPNKPSDEGPEALDEDYQDDWRDYIRSVNPAFDSMSETDQEDLLRTTYQDAVRDFFLATLNKGREMRPNAKWGFYGYPLRFFKWKREAPTHVISYDDGSHAGSRFNDRLQWMWDAVDVITPSVYPAMLVPNDGERGCDRTYTAEDEWMYLRNMIGEAQRVGGGKPVLPFITAKHYLPKDCKFGEEIRTVQLANQIFGPARHGAQGAILWGDINSEHQAMEWQSMLDDSIMPLMAQAFEERLNGDGSDDGGGSGDDALADGGSGKSGKTVGAGAGKKPAGQNQAGGGPKVASSQGKSAPPRAAGVTGTEARRALLRANQHLRGSRKDQP